MSTTFKWGSSPKIKGWEGLNNAAINTFNSNVINSFVRENIQNSNDARQEDEYGNKKKLLLEICVKTIPQNLFPKYEEFLSILKKIANDESNSQHELFFRQALKSIEDANGIEVLIYKDSNTKGLSGRDDDPKSSFNACVLSEGISIKQDEASSGSYGIGKNSIFAISKVRTVFYSSLNNLDEAIFQGVAKLASYKDDEATYESRIYLGKGKLLESIRNDDLTSLNPGIKDFYIKSESGLSQFAICPILTENWMNDFVRAILDNYWPLLYNNELEVSIEDQTGNAQIISAQTLNDLMITYYSPEIYDPNEDTNPNGNPYDYYMCYKEGTPKEVEIHMLGSIKFFYSELDHKKTNRILYIRNGMVISADSIWGFGSIGYCGIVECTNKVGNVLLKMMEPPEHNRFDISRLDSKSEQYKMNDGKRAFDEIKKIIRESLNEILGKYRKKAEDIPWLNNLIQSIKGLSGSGSGNRTGEYADQETTDKISFIENKSLTFDIAENNAVVSAQEGIKGKAKEPIKPILNEDPLPKPQEEPKVDPEPRSPRTNRKKRENIRYRIFRKSIDHNGNSLYKLIIDSSADTTKNFKISQVGDSGSMASFELINVSSGTQTFQFESVSNKANDIVAYQINSVTIPGILEICIKEPYKSTFSIQEVN